MISLLPTDKPLAVEQADGVTKLALAPADVEACLRQYAAIYEERENATEQVEFIAKLHEKRMEALRLRASFLLHELRQKYKLGEKEPFHFDMVNNLLVKGVDETNTCKCGNPFCLEHDFNPVADDDDDNESGIVIKSEEQFNSLMQTLVKATEAVKGKLGTKGLGGRGGDVGLDA